MILDNFLRPETFQILRAHAVGDNYENAVNPHDGVEYPGISLAVPQVVRDEVLEKLCDIRGESVGITALFVRLSSRATKQAPHQAHTDTAMGAFTLLLYLQDGPGGTSLVRHKKTGMNTDPVSPEEFQAWRDDTNNPEAWQVTGMAAMAANRAVIIPSNLMHRAEPIGGFGKGPKDGRLVLTAFYV